MSRYLLVLLLGLCLMSCNTIKINNQVQKKDKSYFVELGDVVVESHQLSAAPKISVMGKPEYTIEIPLVIKKIEPSEKGYKKLKLISNKFKAKDTINTTFKKLGYLPVLIQFKDKIKAIENLNVSRNSNVLDYIKDKPSAKLITSITGLVSLSVYDKLEKAEAVFLKRGNKNVSSLFLYTKDKEAAIVSLEKNVELLTYKSELFCWGADKKRRVVLKDMVFHKCSCEKGTSVKASKIKKKLSYVKL